MHSTACTVLFFLAAAFPAVGGTYYVNNQSGGDDNDGLSPGKAFATIAQAIKAARTSDTISLAKTGVPYREPIPLTKLGGTPDKPFVIEGNGAIINGLRTLKPEVWTKKGAVYQMSGARPYGFPFFVVDGKCVPPGAAADRLQPGQWFWVRNGQDRNKGTLCFRPGDGKTPADYRLEASLEISGIRLSSSSYVMMKNLISEYHSNDGFNIHGDCRGIYCENIEGRFNGDDGFSIHEAIEAVVRNGYFHHNGSGIEDVNLSRSFYSGLRVHDNQKLGVLFIGAFHSAVDALVYDNPCNFKFMPHATKHIVGGELSPIAETSVYLQNVIAWGGDYGVQAAGKCRVMIANCIFSNSRTGIDMMPESRLHLTKSIVADCQDVELRCNGREFFGDYNIYFPGRFVVTEKGFMPEQWDEFRQAVGHNSNSVILDPQLSESHALGDKSPRQVGGQPVGPTAIYFSGSLR